MFTVNTIGVFNCITWAARGMMNTSGDKPRSGGSIVVTVSILLEQYRIRAIPLTRGKTSLASTFGGIGAPAYTTSKHATLGLLRSAAAQLMLARTGIRVNGVAPGPTKTPIGLHAMQSGAMSGTTPSNYRFCAKVSPC